MSEPKLLRRFKNVYNGDSEHLAQEVCYLEIEPNKIKSVYLFKDGSVIDGPVTDEKIYKLNMEGYDIVSTRKDGSESRVRFVGMLEHSAYKEIIEIPVSVAVDVAVTTEIEEKNQATG